MKKLFLAILLVAFFVSGCCKECPDCTNGAPPPKQMRGEKAEKRAEGKGRIKEPGKTGVAEAKTEAKEAPAVDLAIQAHPIVDSPEPVEVLLWHAYRGTERVALDELVERFNDAHTNLKIRSLPIPFDALRDKLQITIPRGQGPDVFIYAHNLIGDWLESESEPLVESVNAWVTDEELVRFKKEAVTPLIYKEALYGLPLALKSAVLYYNKAIVGDEPPFDTDAMLALAKKHTKVDEKRYGLVYEAAGLYFHALFIHGFGGQILDENNEPQLDTPEQIEAAKYVRSLALDSKVVPADMTAFMVASLFNDGKAAMVISGPWFRGDIKEGVDYGVALLPEVTATRQPLKPLLGVEAMFMNAKSEKKKWALEVMRYFSSDESALLRFRKGLQPVPNRAVLATEEVRKDPFIPVFAAQAARAVPMSASRQMQVVWSTMDNALKRAIFDASSDPATALGEAQKKVLHDIGRQKR